MSHGWDTALDAMTDLQRSFQTDEGQKFLASFAVSHTTQVWNKERGEYDVREMDDALHEYAQSLITGTMTTVTSGDPVWVSEEVVDLIEVAEQTFRPEATFVDDPFVPGAFCLLERPMVHVDARGKRMAFRALSWGAANSPDGKELGLLVAMWAHADDEDDYFREFAETNGGRLTIGGSELSLLHMGLIPWGSERVLQEETQADLVRTLQVLWRLAKQEIALPRQERASRASWRRASDWRSIKEVTVMTLRRSRPKHSEGDGEGVEWSHRWLVRGHWRNQPYKIDGRMVHRQIWIAPFVKGPEDRPFVPKQRAIEFTR
jgi:hypothetical protein